MNPQKKIKLKLEHDLAAPSPVFNKLLNLFNKEDISISELLDIIQQDITVTINILKYSNSAYFGSPGKVASLKKSIELIGLIETRNISVCNVLMSNFAKKQYPESFNYKLFWLHSFLTANISKTISKITGIFDENESYIIGLLHDIGWLAVALYLPEDYDSIRQHDNKLKDNNKSIHSLIGMTVVKMWNLPDKISNSILFHTNPGEATSSIDYACLTSLSSRIAVLLENKGIVDEKVFDNFNDLNFNEPQKKLILSEMSLILEKTKEIINISEF